MIKIDNSAKISKFADIEDSVKGSLIKIGANSQIDSFVKIKPAGGVGNLIIGKNSYINSGSVLYIGNGINIGNSVLIAANTVLAPTNHEYINGNKLICEQGFKKSKGGIIIEDDVWIGSNCTLLDGTYICEGAVIGAQSLVRGKIPPYSINFGNPLNLIGFRER